MTVKKTKATTLTRKFVPLCTKPKCSSLSNGLRSASIALESAPASMRAKIFDDNVLYLTIVSIPLVQKRKDKPMFSCISGNEPPTRGSGKVLTKPTTYILNIYRLGNLPRSLDPKLRKNAIWIEAAQTCYST